MRTLTLLAFVENHTLRIDEVCKKMAALTGCELTIGTFYREDANYYTLQMFLFNFKWIGHVVVTFEPGGNLRWYF